MDKSKQYEKIALRFLKEAGLYDAWKEYNKHNFYDKTDIKYIDDIFGASTFTYFLEKEYNFVLKDQSSNIFREYIKNFHPNIPLRYGNDYEKPFTTINKDTHTVNLAYRLTYSPH